MFVSCAVFSVFQKRLHWGLSLMDVCTSLIETWSYLEHVSKCQLDDCVRIPEGPDFWEFNVPSGRNVWCEAPYNLKLRRNILTHTWSFFWFVPLVTHVRSIFLSLNGLYLLTPMYSPSQYAVLCLGKVRLGLVRLSWLGLVWFGLVRLG